VSTAVRVVRPANPPLRSSSIRILVIASPRP
jgi:hypothetical protein